MDNYLQDDLIEKYNHIYESCKGILTDLENNLIKNVETKLENCKTAVDVIIEGQVAFGKNNQDVAVLSCIRQSISTLISNIQYNTKPNNTKIAPNESEESLTNYGIDVEGKGFCTIAGLQSIKTALKSSVILPFIHPQLFEGLNLRNCILLYGPPGTGKTKLAAATAAEAKAKFISITCSNILSHYIGQSEKAISRIFKHVKTTATKTILFIDEIDGFCRSRSDNEPDHTRRLKTEILCQISNFSDHGNGYLICATNCPWQLDTALLRRFQRQLYVPLPDVYDRYHLFKMLSAGTPLELENQLWEELAMHTDGYSSSDIERLIADARVKPIERLEANCVWQRSPTGDFKPYIPGEELTGEIKVCRIDELPPGEVARSPVTVHDVYEALSSNRPSVSSEDIEKLEAFQNGNHTSN